MILIDYNKNENSDTAQHYVHFFLYAQMNKLSLYIIVL